MVAHNLHSLSNLPQQRTPFVGRENELAQIKALLADPTCRLLSLVGPGGIGKTRLAVEVAQESGFQFAPDGMYFEALQPSSSPDYLVSAIAEAVGFQLHASDCTEQLLDYFRAKS